MSRELLVLPFAYGLGFLAAIPIGASQAEVVKRALAQRYASAILTAAGSATSDMAYGFLALLGAGRFLEYPPVLVVCQWGAAAVLLVLSRMTWRQSRSSHPAGVDAGSTGKGASYLTGLTIGICYPPIMLSWLIAAGLAKGTILAGSLHPHVVTGFVLSGGAGLFSYLVVLTLVLRRTRRFLSAHSVRVIYRGLSVLLGLISMVLFINGLLRAIQAA